MAKGSNPDVTPETSSVPAVDAAPPAPPRGIDRLVALVADDLAAVNKTIVARMDSPVKLIPQLASYLTQAGGKRLRPLLTLGCARLCGYEGGMRHVELAACVEFIHTATLLHDDVVDESSLRRGRESANAVWGNKPSVLVGDFLFSRAFELMVEDGSLAVLATLSRASSVIAEGEVLQLLTSNDLETDEAAYMEVIERKTAALFAAAARLGGLVADRPMEEVTALETYGQHLGIAFQIVDDVLDYSARQEALGKTVGDDFLDGKVTLPVVLAYAAGDETERAFWRRCLEDQEIGDDDLAQAMTLMTRHGTLEASLERARGHARTAEQALSRFPEGSVRTALMEAVRFSVDRAA